MNFTYRDATELRFYLKERWGDPASLAFAMALANKLVDSLSNSSSHTGDNQPEPKTPSPLSRKLRVALVVGHNRKQPGADLVGAKRASEYDFNNAVVDAIIRKGVEGVEFKRFNRIYSGSYSSEIDTVYSLVKDWKADCAIEFHFNGGGARYSMTLVSTKAGPVTRKFAAAVQKAFINGFSFQDNGVKELSSGDRGGRSVGALTIPIILTEPFFGDNKEHALKIESIGTDGVADVYIQGIRESVQLFV